MAKRKKTGFRVPRHWSLAQRLAYRSKPGPNGCILFTGALNKHGYGSIHFKGRSMGVHRAAWIAANGEPAPGMDVCHSCDVPSCMNVDHLWLGTQGDNSRDMLRKGRGRWVYGEACGAAKLTTRQARSIFYAAGSHRTIAAKFGVSFSLVSLIKRKKIWKILHGPIAPSPVRPLDSSAPGSA